MFREVPTDVRFPELEERVIADWRERDIFRKSLEKPAPRGPWVFYEGPPTANGKPGVHHVISRAFKDLFPRFRTMQGYHVGRKGGWDTHGLPVEIAIEKRLGFTSKQQVEEYGIERFNALCREYVFENIQDWNRMTERIAFWLDLIDPYVTYDNAYIESCWWVFKSLWERGLLQEDYKTTWHSPSSNTTLASHEVSLGYEEDVEDPSVFPAFPVPVDALAERDLIDPSETRPVRFLAWTTTPWTLPANAGLALAPDASYALVEAPARRGGDPATMLFWLARDCVEATFADDPHRVVGTATGRDFDGLRYQPVLRGEGAAEAEGAHRVVMDDMVSLDEGTGVVHIAPAYGDLELGRKHGLPALFSVDLTGRVMAGVAPLDAPDGVEGPWTGQWFKDADAGITEALFARGTMYHATTLRHAYPLNWRDGQPLMNVAKKSWYIRTTAVKDKLLANNDAIGWVPDGVRTGRFGKWLENNVDWAVSRERYWGCPLPIWEREDGADRICVGSIEELASLTGRDLGELDLHRPYVDEVTFDHGGRRYRRVPYTVDVWFESGAMPYAQWGYKGEASDAGTRAALEANFPADYICEAIDQTRGWFYSLHALGTLLTDEGDETRPPGPLAHLEGDTGAFRNVIVLGHIVDVHGEKMSKSKGNVVDPWTVLNAQGSDALRWYLYASSPPEATKRFSPGLVEEAQRDFQMTLWNTYAFFVLYANLDRPDLRTPPDAAARPDVDQWLVARVNALIRDVTADLEAFDATGAARAIRDFVVNDLSNWYVRRNRKRFWRGGDDADGHSAYHALYAALVTVAKLIAPMTPFLAEELYGNLVRAIDPDAPESVHLADWPEVDADALDDALVRDMAAVVKVVELGRAARATSGVKVRQPLPQAIVRVTDAAELAGVKRFEEQIREELNVRAVRYLDVTDDFVDYEVRPNLPRVGRRLGKRVPAVHAALSEANGREIAARVGRGEDVVLQVEGEEVRLEPEAILLSARSPEGYAAMEEQGYLAALDTTVTPELRLEGLARDVIRTVQNARKNAGLAVSDRIELGLEAGGELREAIDRHRAEIAGEVLARDLALDVLDGASHRESDTVGDDPLTVTLRRLQA